MSDTTGPIYAPAAGSNELPPTTGGPMSSNTHTGLIILAAAALLGWLGDQLILQADQFGLGTLLWVGGLAAAAVSIGRRTGQPLNGEGRWLLAAAVLFAGAMVGRAAPPLLALTVLAMGICLGLAALTARGNSLSRTGVLSYPLGLALSGAYHAVGPLLLLFSDIKWQVVPRGRWSGQVAAVWRGLLIALPLLLLFGLLFAAADAVFAQLTAGLFRWDLDRLFEQLFGTLFCGLLAAGFLRTLLLRNPEPLPQMTPSTFRLGAIETGVVLGLLNLLFLAFVLVQVGYLFGGAELVLQTVDLTYAEYARAGFFELVEVTALVLPVMLALHWLLPAGPSQEQRLFRWLGGSLIGMLFLIMGSAMQRMLLYQQEYGLTEQRLYSTAFMGWMALLFGWFLFTVLRGQRERFALGALVSGLLVLTALHAINPDALIVRTNLAHGERTGRFDADYAASLGPDAVPVLLEALPRLSEADQELVRERIEQRLQDLDPADWRTWSWGRSQARQAMTEMFPPKP